jgi:hypothetical protein
MLHESLLPLTGLDLSSFFGKGKLLLWEPWVRAAFSIRSSPYQAFQEILVAKEYILGDRKDPKNIFRWDLVPMNLPGLASYDPRLPWVSKIRIDDGSINHPVLERYPFNPVFFLFRNACNFGFAILSSGARDQSMKAITANNQSIITSNQSIVMLVAV